MLHLLAVDGAGFYFLRNLYLFFSGLMRCGVPNEVE